MSYSEEKKSVMKFGDLFPASGNMEMYVLKSPPTPATMKLGKDATTQDHLARIRNRN